GLNAPPFSSGLNTPPFRRTPPALLAVQVKFKRRAVLSLRALKCWKATRLRRSGFKRPGEEVRLIDAAGVQCEKKCLSLAEEAADDEPHVGGALAQSAHEVRKPFASEGHVDPHSVTLLYEAGLQIAPDP